MVSVMLYPCILCVSLLVYLFVLCEFFFVVECYGSVYCVWRWSVG